LTWDNFGLFIKEGSIIPTFAVGDQRVKSTEQFRDKDQQYDLIVCLDGKKQAEGFLYIDDGKTLEYQNEVRSYISYLL
jgi:alpha-glucosidase (family GH31 glycosyl hydrolase)